MSDKIRLEDNVEEIMLGLDLGTDSGEYHNTEIADGKLQLKQIEGSDEYESEGYWVSEVIDLEYKFKDYQKVSLDKDTVAGSEVVIEYRTSDDESGILEEEWKMTEPDGKFSGETKQLIQIKLNLVPKNEPVDNLIDFKSEEDIEKLNEEDREYFKVEDEKLFLNGEISVESEFIVDVNVIDLPKEKFSEINKLILGMDTGMGSQQLIAGDLERGFYGEVSASEIFTAEELSDLLEITEGQIQFNDVPWLKFAYKGKTLFRPKKAFRSHISWDHINSKGAVYGGKVVEHEAGYRFDVRLMKSVAEGFDTAEGDREKTMPNSEWNHLMLPIHEQAKDASWAYPQYVEGDVPYWGIDYTDEDLHTHSRYGNGTYVWCQEHWNAGSTYRVYRGLIGASGASYNTSSNTGGNWGWAPVLELLAPPKKILIKKDSQYGYYTEGSTQFISLGTEQPTEEQFNEFGMPDLTILDSERLSDLLEANNIQILNLPESEEDTDTLVIKGELKHKPFTHLEQPINSSEIDRLITQDSSIGVRYLFSDNKTEWKALSSDNTWETVVWEDNSELLQKGMSKNAIRDVKSEQWDSLGESIYVGIYINDNDSYVESIIHQIFKAINTPKISDAKLYILNTKATIDLQFKSNTLFGSLTDDDTGKVQYKVILNGENLVPEDDEFTELSPSPENINIPIPKDKIKQGETNTIEVQFQDAWGSTDTWSTTFIGREFGILFMDEDEDLYSDAKGNILKPLELGDVVIGESTDSQAIKLKNDTELDLENVVIQSVLSEEIDGATFLFSLDSEGEYTKQLKLPKLALDEVITFYVKLDTVLDVTPEIKSNALFTVKATGVNPTL